MHEQALGVMRWMLRLHGINFAGLFTACILGLRLSCLYGIVSFGWTRGFFSGGIHTVMQLHVHGDNAQAMHP